MPAWQPLNAPLVLECFERALAEMERILLLSGALCSGKTILANTLLSKYGYGKISSSTHLRSLISSCELLEEWDRRSRLQELGDRLDEETNYLWIVDPVAIESMREKPDVENWLIDAVRKKKQVEHFRIRFGGCVRHVHLTAPEEVLRARFAERTRESEETYEKAIAHSNEINARSLGAIADRVFDTSELDTDSITTLIQTSWRP